MRHTRVKLAATLFLAAVLSACAPQQRWGMVEDPTTGLQWGSVVQRNIVVDASQFRNPKVKVRIRNTSGDTAFDLYGFQGRIEQALAAKGYTPTRGNDFGILFDVNVLYSGQVTTNLSNQFAFLGGASGAIAGFERGNTTGAAYTLAGATLGAIIGSYVTDDTYIIVSEVSLAVTDAARGKSEETITFSASGDKKEKERSNFKPFREGARNKVAVYAGGRNTPQSEIAGGVRERFARIIADII